MRRILLMCAVIIITLVGGQGQALAYDFVREFDDDVSIEDTAPNSPDKCTTLSLSSPAAKGCFKKYGDRWYIQRLNHPDSNDKYIYWENWLWNGSEWKPYRHGQCNNLLGPEVWGLCNNDYYESSSINYFGSKGSKIRFQVCVRRMLFDSCNPGVIESAAWVHNDG